MRILCGLLMATLALAPIRAFAQAPEDGTTVEQLYGEGRDFYETADYDGAIAKWTKAYSMVGDSPKSSEIRANLLYNLASAHEEAYRIDGDVTHLTKARVLLERFAQNIDQLYEREAVETERQRVSERIATIDAKLLEARVTNEPEPEPEPEAEPEPVPEPDPGADTPADTPR
jgi:hypothetical protein